MPSDNTNPRRRLYAVSFINEFIVFLVVFTIGRELAERRLPLTTLAVAGAGLTFFAAMASLMSGRLSDIFGRKRLIFTAASLQVLSAVLCASLNLKAGLHLVLPAYWMLGFSSGILYAPVIAWLNQGEDTAANAHGVSRTLILFCLAWNFGMMGGQLTGGWLFPTGPQSSFMLAVALSLVNVVLVATTTHQAVSSSEVMVSEASASRHPLASVFVRLGWLANFGGTFAGGMVFFLLPDLIVSIGMSSETHGTLLAIWRAAIVATYLLMHRLKFWRYRLSTAMVSQVLAAAGLMLISIADGALMLVTGMALLGQLVGYNYFASLCYSTAGSPDESRGFMASVHEATLCIGMVTGTLAGGFIGETINSRGPYVLAASVVVLLAVVQILAYQRWMRPAPSCEAVEA
jgi:MFS family permease